MKRMFSIAFGATLLVMLVAARASAAPTYHGTWDGSGAASFVGCSEPSHSVEGNWNVTLLDDGRAVVHYTTFEPMHLMSVGGAKLSVPPKVDGLWQQLETTNGETFVVATNPWGTPITMTMTLIGHDLTFRITPYFTGSGEYCDWGQAAGTLLH